MLRLLPFAVALVLVPAAGAAQFTFSVVTSSPVTVPTVTLNGDDQTQAVSVVTQVAYTGGNNNAGWKVQASAGVPTSASNTLPAIVVTDGSAACQGSCTTNPTPTGITYPITLSASAQTIYNAGASTGRGTFNVTSALQLSYPANALPGTYTSTVTLSGSTGP
jgi:hypothetical protein